MDLCLTMDWFYWAIEYEMEELGWTIEYNTQPGQQWTSMNSAIVTHQHASKFERWSVCIMISWMNGINPTGGNGKIHTDITLTNVVFPEYCRPTRVNSISSFQKRDFIQSSSLFTAFTIGLELPAIVTGRFTPNNRGDFRWELEETLSQKTLWQDTAQRSLQLSHTERRQHNDDLFLHREEVSHRSLILHSTLSFVGHMKGPVYN